MTANDRATGDRVDAYFEAKARFEEARSARRLAEAVEHARHAVACLAPYAGWYLETGKRPDALNGPGLFLADACILFAVTGNTQALSEARQRLASVPGTEVWRGVVARGVHHAALNDRILATVSAQPGVLQTKFPALVAAEADAVREVCYWLAELGRVHRRKQGRSFGLYPGPAEG
ncbi:MAG: hypothetical protein HY907_10370 [Deltaproteobacteria bacterium]|nr:hypothetical protein [Deltaproteobacteria bacterium]